MRNQRIHAFTDDALADLDTVGLVEALQAGRVAIPEVVEAALARIDAVDGRLNGIAHLDAVRARAAAQSPQGGYFAGVPTLVKDNVDVAGMPTMQGTDAWVGRPATVDGDFARMFLATGLLPLGRSRMSEFGFSPSAEHPRLGPVRNPWDPTRIAGASSAGAGALVAAGAVPLAHGNDGGGSIRIPASVNGLVGLKPTRGRLAQDKMLRQMPVRIVHDGVLTRSVRDTVAFFREAEKVYRPLELAPIGDVSRPSRKRLRIALNTSGLLHPASAEVDRLTRTVADRLNALGHHVEEVDALAVPDSFPDDFLLYWSFLAASHVSTGRRLHGRSWDPSRLDGLTRGLARHCRRHAHRLPGAIARLRRTRKAAQRFHRDHDVLLTPTLAHQTPEVGHFDPTQPFETMLERLLAWVAFTPLQNATGAPAISLPLARTAAGLPQGMMFSAGIGREALLLGLALELEEAFGFDSITAG